MTKCVVAYGNPFDGVQLVGPFSDGNEAGEWADVALRDTEWWLVGLEPTGGAAGRAQRFLHPASPEQGDTEVLLEGLPEADLVTRLRQALEDLHSEVEMAESVGVCLPDRVPSLRAGALLAELYRG